MLCRLSIFVLPNILNPLNTSVFKKNQFMRNLYPGAAVRCLKIFTLLFFISPFTINAQESMRANLYVVDANGATLVDGNLTNYNNIYSNAVDVNDAWKMINPGINFGILRESTDLVVERRSLIGTTDTTYFKMWNMPQYHYRIRFVLKNLNHPGLKAVLNDNYLNSETEIGLNDTTFFDFTITGDPSSANTSRFQLIFRQASVVNPLDVNFTGIKAHRKGNDVAIEWNVATETDMSIYSIEQSANGRDFHSIGNVAPFNTSSAKTYTYYDKDPVAGDNFYRIKGTSLNGKVQYSSIAKIAAATSTAFDVNIYPNPVTHKTAQVSFKAASAGKYDVVIISANGTRRVMPSLQLDEGNSSTSVQLPAETSAGIYLLQFTGPGNIHSTKRIVVMAE